MSINRIVNSSLKPSVAILNNPRNKNPSVGHLIPRHFMGGSQHLKEQARGHFYQKEVSSVKPFNWKPLLVFGLTFGIALFGLNAADAKESNSSKQAEEVVTLMDSNLESIEWVKKALELYPEISFLADEKVCYTQEGTASNKASYSEKLYGKKFIEFDRTLMTLHCMRLIIDGSEQAYQIFTEAQPESVKLSKESFQKLHQEAKSLTESKWSGLNEAQMKQALETALVLGDIEKSEIARKKFASFGITAPDHDDFHGEVMEKHPEELSSYRKLPEAGKDLLRITANPMHYGHFTHLEGGEEMFSHILGSEILKDSFLLSVSLFVHKCDVAGALGHINHSSSIVCTESTFQAMHEMGEAVKILEDPSKCAQDALDAYLKKRAEWIGLDFTHFTDKISARLAAMLRIFDPEEGKIIQNTLERLNSETKNKILKQLEFTRSDLRTPTYMPAVLVNLINNQALGKTKEERLEKAILLGLPLLTSILELHKKEVEEGNLSKKNPLCFNQVAAVAKSAPSALEAPKFYIDSSSNCWIIDHTKYLQ